MILVKTDKKTKNVSVEINCEASDELVKEIYCFFKMCLQNDEYRMCFNEASVLVDYDLAEENTRRRNK